LRTYDQLRTHLKQAAHKNLLVAPFFSMVDRRKKLHREVTSLLENGANGYLETNIPYASIVEQMGLRQAPLATYDTRSAATRAYRALWKEIQRMLSLQKRIERIKMW
jgi:cellulose biosynthesis protein BcsQ